MSKHDKLIDMIEKSLEVLEELESISKAKNDGYEGKYAAAERISDEFREKENFDDGIYWNDVEETDEILKELGMI